MNQHCSEFQPSIMKPQFNPFLKYYSSIFSQYSFIKTKLNTLQKEQNTEDLIHNGMLLQISDEPMFRWQPVIDSSFHILIAVSRKEQLSCSCQETCPRKSLKNSVFCKFHMENERFCSDVVKAIYCCHPTSQQIIQNLTENCKIQ